MVKLGFWSKIISYISKTDKNWLKKTSKQRLKLADQYSKKRELDSLKNLIKKISKLFK